MVNGVTKVFNEYVKEKRLKDRALRHTGSYLRRYGEITRNTNRRLSY
jgi:hypothetical protein